MHLFSDCTADLFAESDEFAPAGPDGARAASLLAEAKRDGAEVFAAACESAVNRLLASGNPLDAGTPEDEEKSTAHPRRPRQEIRRWVRGERYVRVCVVDEGDVKNLLKLASFVEPNGNGLTAKTIEYALQFKPTKTAKE